MTSQLILIACATAVITCGLVAGVFLAFSDFVMKSLHAARPASGIESMQLINRKVYGSIFLALLIAMAVASVCLAAYTFLRMSGPEAVWIIAGCALYAIGVFVVTVVFNVPMNQRLDAMNHASEEAASYWAIYARSWTSWNHVRTLASAGAATCFLIGSLTLNAG
jgi:uncharacterized membrane protein